MTHIQPTTIYLKDYTPPTFNIEKIWLSFELDEAVTIVRSRLEVVRNTSDISAPLVLNGRKLELVSIMLDEKTLSNDAYQVNDEQLIITKVPDKFTLEIVTHIKPKENSELTGLYVSRGIFCTQCEAEGFRRITYYIDRPDVMARFTTTIIADKTHYPVLLSNGNPTHQGDLAHNRHFVTWEDPFKKPSYLFALVAGDLDCLEDSFMTCSKRRVALKIFSEKGQRDKCHYAMESVKKAMRWDEENYGREYDLDIFMIAAISDFNMGAMENKGLNIFNSKYILVNPETATDTDYEHVQLVVGHEYFHNWTGDRITCRDWFQLSLKEGLTVFREQEFTQDMTSHAVARIDEVRGLRDAQFSEDAGPLAHPVQPASYIEINNFYTMTVYNKGAEVIRMLKTLLGIDQFRRSMDLYFERHDGQAVTIQDFVKVFEDVSGRDLTQFRLWYSQSGTPELHVTSAYDANNKIFALTVKQTCPPTPGQVEKKPFYLPLTIGLLNTEGCNLPLQPTTGILEISKATETFQFTNISTKPIPSLLRNFSAPMKLYFDYSDAELYFLLTHDSDAFNRWEAGQRIACRVMLNLINPPLNPLQGGDFLSPPFIEAFHTILTQKTNDESFTAELLTLPSESYLGDLMDIVDVDGIHQTRQFTRRELAKKLFNEFLMGYETRITAEPYSADQISINRRRLKNTCLAYLMLQNDEKIRAMCMQQFRQANNMTDVIAALYALANTDCAEREPALREFYQKWQHDNLVIDKWFAIQASSELPGTLTHVKALLQHPAFDYKNPNRVRSVIGVFCQTNHAQFHAKDGAGYKFLAEQVLKLDRLNPQIAARLLQPLTNWRRYDIERQKLMREQLQHIVSTKNLSKDAYEITSKSLD
jgi:aminopeptidase N